MPEPVRFTFSASVYVIWRTWVLLVFHKSYDVWLPPGGELEPNEKPWSMSCKGPSRAPSWRRSAS